MLHNFPLFNTSIMASQQRAKIAFSDREQKKILAKERFATITITLGFRAFGRLQCPFISEYQQQ
jgi:hypothetical protein